MEALKVKDWFWQWRCGVTRRCQACVIISVRFVIQRALIGNVMTDTEKSLTFSFMRNLFTLSNHKPIAGPTSLHRVATILVNAYLLHAFGIKYLGEIERCAWDRSFFWLPASEITSSINGWGLRLQALENAFSLRTFHSCSHCVWSGAYGLLRGDFSYGYAINATLCCYLSFIRSGSNTQCIAFNLIVLPERRLHEVWIGPVRMQELLCICVQDAVLKILLRGYYCYIWMSLNFCWTLLIWGLRMCFKNRACRHCPQILVQGNCWPSILSPLLTIFREFFVWLLCVDMLLTFLRLCYLSLVSLQNTACLWHIRLSAEGSVPW